MGYLKSRLHERLPPSAPPYTGGEMITKHTTIPQRSVSSPCVRGRDDCQARHHPPTQRVLPLCKGELEGVVFSL